MVDELFSFRQDKQNIRDTLDRLDTWTDRADRTDAVDRTGQDRTGQDRTAFTTIAMFCRCFAKKQ